LKSWRWESDDVSMSVSNSGSLTTVPQRPMTKNARMIRTACLGSSATIHRATSGTRYGNDNMKLEASEIASPVAIHSRTDRSDTGCATVRRTTSAITGIPAMPSPTYGTTIGNIAKISAPRNAGTASTSRSLRSAFIATIATKLVTVVSRNDAAHCGRNR
jgi:hypothetical protein